MLRTARSVLFVIEEVLPLPRAQEEPIAERLLNEYILKVEGIVEVPAIAVRRKLHAVGPAWIKHVTKEIDAHAPQLKATFVLRTSLSLFRIQGTTSRIRIGESRLHLATDIHPIVSISAGEVEPIVVARDGTLFSE